MTRFILTRACYSLITLWLLVTIVFGFVRFTGDPASMLEEVGDAAYVAQLRQQWGLDRPYHVQYVKYMWGLLQGDFGNSFQKSLAVRDIYFATRIFENIQGIGSSCYRCGWEVARNFVGLI